MVAARRRTGSDTVRTVPAPRSLVSFGHVGCSYGETVAVEDTSFTICADEFVGIVGPSGSGKTTVLKALLDIVEPLYGRIERAPDLRVAYVPQLETIDWSFPATVADVVTMSVPRRRFRRPDPAFTSGITDLLDRLGLEGLHDRHIRELSGGQQQRVFIARALAQRPELLVLDEPASGVDVATRHEMLHVLDDLHRSGVAIVLTTHDINGLAAHLPRVICFNRTVIADGRPDDVLHPYVLERTYGAPMQVLRHGGMPLVVEHRSHGPHVAGGGAAEPRR